MNERAILLPQKTASLANTPVQAGLLQRKCACGGTPGPTGECEQCKRKRLALQRKLAINEPGDRYEQEADRVAETIMRGGIAGRNAISSLGQGSAVQREEPAKPKREEGKAEEPKKKEDETLQRKATDDHEVFGAPPIVDEVLQSPGQPLDAATRNFMEQRFGYDFGSVRVHHDARAAESARAVNAHAYTVGHDIAFNGTAFAPDATAGRKLLAHELTHVVQQSAQHSAPCCQRQTGGPLLTGTHKPGGPSLRLVGAEDVMGFNVTRAMCQCKEGDLLDGQIAKDDRAIAAYRECGKTVATTDDLLPCILPKVFGQQAGTTAQQVPPAGETSTETNIITQANQAEVKKRAQLLNLPESGPCAELLRAGNLVHERRHVVQHEQAAAEEGAAFAAEYNRLVWDEHRMDKLRAKFPRETAQYEKKTTADVQRSVAGEVDAYQQEKQFYTQVKAALGRICAVPTPTIGQPNIPPVQRKAVNLSEESNEALPMPDVVHEVLHSPGQPLDSATRAYMEPRFSYNFGNVRVHNDRLNLLPSPPEE